jgi:intein-encoded DNA endonuclease-like protein
MNWDYIAGFFDGEGNISYTDRSRYNPSIGKKPKAQIVQKDIRPLREIGLFLISESITHFSLQRLTGGYYLLNIEHMEDLRTFLKNVVFRLVLKQTQAGVAIEALDRIIPEKWPHEVPGRTIEEVNAWPKKSPVD